jgi:hypothetical protein
LHFTGFTAELTAVATRSQACLIRRRWSEHAAVADSGQPVAR